MKKERFRKFSIDILTFLTGISSRDGEKFPVLRKAIRTVTQVINEDCCKSL
ncbi:hypothetical protein [Enterococcus faecalis]|uniref:hypothetical protein n=1 Tax=Enterococcus faecalis TaxID=1351 RepID=UPI0035AC1000